MNYWFLMYIIYQSGHSKTICKMNNAKFTQFLWNSSLLHYHGLLNVLMQQRI